ncbi:hypothetical protein [Pseudooceanicola algae]|uniref:Pentapeptide repeat-containing protein n=1 Tax=Pseudooceanicola algae TaxID=1537215 RepID=A0A418SJY2_9RHOB|nr:hypothetical protein [Pseudooceanicola algae]QPM92219.1 hypothetical protein PSAL_034830 [Pseudooceanicola algae]
MPRADLTDLTPHALIDALCQPFEAGQALDLTGRRITGPVDLSGLALCGFDLSGSVFEGRVTMEKTTCWGLTWFRDCHFAAPFAAAGALFLHDLRVDDAHFAAEVTLTRTEARGTMVLDRAHFDGPAWLDRMQVLSSLSMARARFDGPVSLEETEAYGGFWADRTTFGGRLQATGLEVHGRTWIRGATLAPAGPAAPPQQSLARQIRSFGYIWS